MQFDIALKLGMTVSEIQTKMTSEEFIQWVSYLGILADEHKEAEMKAKHHSRKRNRR